MEKGYIMLNRKLFVNPLWSEARVYSKVEAWIDLIQLAGFETSTVILNGKVIDVQRGELPASRRFLELRWKWGSTKVSNFLKTLSDLDMINQRTNQGQTIIKLLNYDIYNSPQTTGKPSNKPKANQGQTTDKPPANQNKEYKEYKESKESKELKENNNPPTPYGEGFDDPEKKLNFRARAYFEYFYRETFGEPYYWEAKDAGNMSGILKKLVFRQKKKGVSNPGDEAIIAAWKGFLSAVSGEWITDNFSVSIINSKFNAIISNYSKQKKKENETEEKRITYI